MGLFQKKQTEVQGTVVSIRDFTPMEAQYYFGKKFTKGFASGEVGYFQPVVTYVYQGAIYTKPASVLYRGRYYREQFQLQGHVRLIVSEKNAEKFKIVF